MNSAARRLAVGQELRALCNRGGPVDWQALKQLGVREVQHAGNWELMPRMPANRRADFLLAPCQATPDLSLRVGDVTLLPIPGIKVALRGSRHCLLSARHPGATALKKCLDLGVERLCRQGVLRRAYAESGFFYAAVAHWITLSQPWARLDFPGDPWTRAKHPCEKGCSEKGGVSWSRRACE